MIKEGLLTAAATLTEEGISWVHAVFGAGPEDSSIRSVTSLQSRKASHRKMNPEAHITCGAAALKNAGRIP